MNYSKQLLLTMPCTEHRLFFSCFLISNMGKLCLKTVTVQVIPPQVTQMKVWRKFAKLVTKTDKAAFWRSLVGLASSIEHSSV